MNLKREVRKTLITIILQLTSDAFKLLKASGTVE